MEHLQNLRNLARLAGFVPLAMRYHLVSVAGNLIDNEEGLIEHRVSQLFARRVLEHLGLAVEVSGAEQVSGLERYAVVATHSSYLDWAVLLGYFPSPMRCIGKRELTRVPVIGYYLRSRGVLIDRKRGMDARRAIGEATKDDQPWPFLIFPEGTRSHDGEVRPFRRGGLTVLVQAGITLLPVAVRGTHEALPRGAVRVRAGQPLRLCIGQPVLPDEAPTVELQLDLVEQRVRALATD